MSTALDKIIKAKDTKELRETVPEWDNVVILIKEPVRGVINRLQDDYLKLDLNTGGHLEGSDAEGFGNALLMAMLHDEHGEKIFESIEQVQEVLKKKSMLVQTRLLGKCSELIKGPMDDSVKEAEGNSGAIQS